MEIQIQVTSTQCLTGRSPGSQRLLPSSIDVSGPSRLCVPRTLAVSLLSADRSLNSRASPRVLHSAIAGTGRSMCGRLPDPGGPGDISRSSLCCLPTSVAHGRLRRLNPDIDRVLEQAVDIMTKVEGHYIVYDRVFRICPRISSFSSLRAILLWENADISSLRSLFWRTSSFRSSDFS